MICKRIFIFVTLIIVANPGFILSDELKLERKKGNKYQTVVLKDVFVVEETPNCLRYLAYNKDYQSPEPRLANKTEGGDEQNAEYKKSADEERKSILIKWRKQSYNAKIMQADGSTEIVCCISIKYPLSSTTTKYEVVQPWQKPAILLRDGSELKFSALDKIQLDPKTACAEIKDRKGKVKNVQYVIKRRVYNGDLNGVLVGVTEKYTYYRTSLEKILSIEFIK
jgi:hypothetical protein